MRPGFDTLAIDTEAKMNSNNTNDRKLVITGIGGQGVVFLTRLISQTAVNLGYPVMVSETHGMSQRGGSVISHVKINGNEAPLIQRGTADFMIAMDPNEAMLNLDFVRRGGMVFVNANEGLLPDLNPHLDRLNIEVVNLPAGTIAIELGSPAVANIVMAGFVVAHPVSPLPIEKMAETIEQISSTRAKQNLQALEAGFQAGRKRVEDVYKILENHQ